MEMVGTIVKKHRELPVMIFQDRADWEAWLSDNEGDSPGVWLKFAKKGSGQDTLSKQQAIEAALCFGWIDGQLDRYDESFWLVRFTPRGPKSRWSKINQGTALRLIAKERMQPAGLARIAEAKSDGRWNNAYASQSNAEVPDDLRAALNANPKAGAFFATLTGANRYAILYRIGDAKTAKTRSARIDKFVAMLAHGETIHPRKA